MFKITILLLSIGILSLYSCKQSNNQQEHQNQKKPISIIEDNSITNLYDAFGKERKGLTKDFGFSALVKYKGKLILFDAGTNADILKANTDALGIDLSKVDFAIGSHAHGDHINGFDYLLEVNPDVKIYLPHDFYLGANINFNIEGKEKYVMESLPEEMQYFGGEKELQIKFKQSGRFWNANVEYIKENTELEPGINLIFTRSPYLGYGSKYPSVDGSHEIDDDEVKFTGLPELSLSISTEDGEALIVGCSHSSVQKIANETKDYTNKPINLIYGGYHMLPYDRNEINIVASKLKNNFNVKKLAPTHCTGHLAFKILKDTFGDDYCFAGLGETIKINP